MTNCGTLSNRGPFNPPFVPSFYRSRNKKKIFDFDIKGAQVFFFSFLMRMKMLFDGAFLPNKTFQFNQIIELNGG